jgi:hypothetical protein
VTLPKPEAGLVIRYSYLWQSEHEQGREEGTKDRPCAIILALPHTGGRDSVLVVPITHSEPIDLSASIELPASIKKRLGLDTERSWVIVSESNEFVWPGPDLRPRGEGDLGTVAYGLLPPNFFTELRRRFVALERARKSRRVTRTE